MDTVFGGGIQQIEKDRQAKQQANIQAVLNQQRKDGNYDALGAFGTQLGTRLGDKLSKKIFGDPEMDQARADQQAVEAIRSQYEPSDPRFGYALSDLFRQRGDMKTSIAIFNQAEKQEKQIKGEQNKEIQEEALSKLLNNPARQDLITEYIKAGGDPKIVIDILQQQNSKNPLNKNNISTSLRKYYELIEQGVGADSALDIAFNISQVYTDPTSGDLVIFDPRDQDRNNDPRDPDKNNNNILRKGTKQQELLEKKVTDLSEALEKSNILEMSNIFNLVDKQILQAKGDIPGIGGTSNLPAIALSKEGVANRQLLSQLQNMTLKDRSGAAVTAPEFDRLKTELGTGAFSTDEQVVNALIRMKQAFDNHAKGIRAGYSDEVNALYDKRANLPAGGSIRLKYNSDTGEFE
jgi:hypothetical protein